MSHRAEVVVVGAGVIGCATAWALARRGREVLVLEQFELDHERGSSHGRSRIFRLAYPEPEWVRLAQEALGLWRELEREEGEELLRLDGLLELVPDLSRSSAPALEACGIAWEELAPDEVERRFAVRVPAGLHAMLQPDAGIVRADRARHAFLAAARARGARVEEGVRVGSPDELDAGAVVVTAGAWVNRLVAPPLPVRVTRETVAYFRLDDPRPVPSVVDFEPGGRGHDFYALADPVHGLKAGAHHGGVEADPDAAGEPDPAVLERIAAWTVERFPVASPEPAAAQTCLYTSTADERFLLERRGRVVVGSACSGHGFKFAPAVGERLAALVAEALG